MKNIDEKYVIEKYAEGSSTIQIAKELDTYPKKIERILKKNNQIIRSRSESQKLAIKKGRSKHPTEGMKRTEEEKIAISKGVEKAWKNMSEEDREAFPKTLKKDGTIFPILKNGKCKKKLDVRLDWRA